MTLAWARRRWRVLAAAGLGGTAALAQAPVDAWYLLVPALAALVALAPGTLREGFWYGWAAGTGHFLVAFNWLVEPFLIDFWRHVWLAPFALVGLSAAMGLYWAVALALAARFGPARPLAIAGLLTIAEAARASWFTGFPWAMLSYGWLETPLIQTVDLWGPHGLTLLTLLAAAGLAGLARLRWTGPLAGAVLLALLDGIGWLRVGAPLEPGPEAPTVRVVQPNAAQRGKWDPEAIPIWWERTQAMTEGGDADLVVWPEVAIPYVMDGQGAHLADVFADIARRADAHLIAGIRRLDGPLWHNSLVVLDPAGRVLDIYDKHHLVPWGEYMPFADWFARFGIFGLAGESTAGYAPGPGPRTLTIPGLVRFTPLICYEAIFPLEAMGAAGESDALIQITNDAWFGTLTGPYQHLAQARIRAIEQGKPVVRAATTGVSALIDSDGRVLAQIELGEAGVIEAELPPSRHKSLYARIGDAAALLCAAMLTLVAAGRTVYFTKC